MKPIVIILSAVLVTIQSFAQTETPNGFVKGTIVLADNSVHSGLIKENLKKDASVAFIDEAGKKKNYSGNELLSFRDENNSFIAIKGDFFKVITDGEVKLLQKVSDASGKASYNGTEVIFINGTEGKPGNYFIYNSNKQLKLITKKTFSAIVEESLAGNLAAIEKAKASPNDMEQLKLAVEMFNRK